MEISRLEDWREFASFVRRAYAKAGANALGWAGASDEVIAELTSEETAKRVLASNRTLAARENGEILGIISCRGVSGGGREEGGEGGGSSSGDNRSGSNSTVVELSGIVVDEDAKGRGVGSALIERLLDECRGAGASLVYVKTEVNNLPALAFYRKHGFEPREDVDETVSGGVVRCTRLERRL
ncbi:MAG TPA: GNAT family N-acetyltransferase [Candidatus Methanomethylicus sp.]|nr:GNAT family N-acetyltransferase [Candidatus Methanomethylicus sp.]